MATAVDFGSMTANQLVEYAEAVGVILRRDGDTIEWTYPAFKEFTDSLKANVADVAEVLRASEPVIEVATPDRVSSATGSNWAPRPMGTPAQQDEVVSSLWALATHATDETVRLNACISFLRGF